MNFVDKTLNPESRARITLDVVVPRNSERGLDRGVPASANEYVQM